MSDKRKKLAYLIDRIIEEQGRSDGNYKFIWDKLSVQHLEAILAEEEEQLNYFLEEQLYYAG